VFPSCTNRLICRQMGHDFSIFLPPARWDGLLSKVTGAQGGIARQYSDSRWPRRRAGAGLFGSEGTWAGATPRFDVAPTQVRGFLGDRVLAPRGQRGANQKAGKALLAEEGRNRQWLTQAIAKAMPISQQGASCCLNRRKSLACRWGELSWLIPVTPARSSSSPIWGTSGHRVAVAVDCSMPNDPQGQRRVVGFRNKERRAGRTRVSRCGRPVSLYPRNGRRRIEVARDGAVAAPGLVHDSFGQALDVTA